MKDSSSDPGWSECQFHCGYMLWTRSARERVKALDAHYRYHCKKRPTQVVYFGRPLKEIIVWRR